MGASGKDDEWTPKGSKEGGAGIRADGGATGLKPGGGVRKAEFRPSGTTQLPRALSKAADAEANFTLAKAVEVFVEQIVEGALHYAVEEGRSELTYDDIATSLPGVARNNELLYTVIENSGVGPRVSAGELRQALGWPSNSGGGAKSPAKSPAKPAAKSPRGKAKGRPEGAGPKRGGPRAPADRRDPHLPKLKQAKLFESVGRKAASPRKGRGAE